ncbi:MLO-like protein 1 [Neltuma alba]|uniref:MLO-like protein 1 n=1 Tax=Neltuma alba TaxID=207710 RepID=UPI0010A4F956|nr:MLO-like protein 1 [Prosopis alba]
MAGGGEATTDVYTPTWVVAVVYTVIVGVSYGVERLLHRAGESRKEKQKTALCEALQKIKEELMLLGFISLLLTVSEKRIVKICVSPGVTHGMIPCWTKSNNHSATVRHLLAAAAPPSSGAKIEYCAAHHCFWKQFCGSVNESDYVTLRSEFMEIREANPKFNFHKHMIEALEVDFNMFLALVGNLWIFVVIFFLINVNGWHTYFWIAFIPLILLLAVGTKLEHVLMLLVRGVDASNADNHFWVHRPSFVLLLIHFILFRNSFEIAFFFWIWAAYSFDACVMGQFAYIIVRLVTGVFSQVL